jgi:hypothetical protein
MRRQEQEEGLFYEEEDLFKGNVQKRRLTQEQEQGGRREEVRELEGGRDVKRLLNWFRFRDHSLEYSR